VTILPVSGVLFWSWKEWNTVGPSTIYSPRFNYRGAYIFFPVLLINHPLSLFWKEENAWYAIFFLCQLMPATITPGIVHLDKVAFVLLMLQTLVGLLNRPSAHSFPMGNFDLMKYT